MAAGPSGTPHDDIAVTLRAAGCVFAEDEARLILEAADGPAEVASMVERRVSGLPLEVIIGWAKFCGLRILVEPGVFVPRRRTEAMVREAVARAAPGAVVLDLCCGTGAVGAAIHAAVDAVELYASDLERAAVRCARRNLERIDGRVFEGDLYAPLPDALRGRVDLLVVNAPYVPTASIRLMPPEARLHEPRVTLDGGADGVDIQRRVAAGAGEWLAPGGHLMIETSQEQTARTIEAFTAGGLSAEVRRSDEVDGTVVVGHIVI